VGWAGGFVAAGGGGRVGPGIEFGSLLGTRVRGVAVWMKKRLGVRVGVLVGVTVGVGVMVGVFEAVEVGRVPVGNGPRSASEVNATAVRVPLTLAFTPSPRTVGRSKMITYVSTVSARHKRHPSRMGR